MNYEVFSLCKYVIRHTHVNVSRIEKRPFHTYVSHFFVSSPFSIRMLVSFLLDNLKANIEQQTSNKERQKSNILLHDWVVHKSNYTSLEN